VNNFGGAGTEPLVSKPGYNGVWQTPPSTTHNNNLLVYGTGAVTTYAWQTPTQTDGNLLIYADYQSFGSQLQPAAPNAGEVKLPNGMQATPLPQLAKQSVRNTLNNPPGVMPLPKNMPYKAGKPHIVTAPKNFQAPPKFKMVLPQLTGHWTTSGPVKTH
jgi:hypothetical protein